MTDKSFKDEQQNAGPWVKTALAASICLAVGSVQADMDQRSKLRLVLNDEISSKPALASSMQASNQRLAVDVLIQSHPDPLLTELESRYQSLPPIDQAIEQFPERYIAAVPLTQQLANGAIQVASNVAAFVPRVRTMVRYDSIDGINQPTPGENPDTPRRRNYSTVLATVNPTFEYNTANRKWAVNATYDYERGRYYNDRDSEINDHILNAKWSMKLDRGNEIEVSTLIEDTDDRNNIDPIEDFDSALESAGLDYRRYLVNLLYRNGTLRDRSRYDLYVFDERSALKADDLFDNGYDLDRVGFGGMYAWQLRRQLSLVAEGRYQDFDYARDFRDNHQFRALVGTDLIFGRRLHANLRIGYEEKSFTNSSLPNDSLREPVWEGMMQWALRRSTSVKLETGREIFDLANVSDPFQVGRFNVQDWVRTAWNERWNEKFSTQASYTYRDTDFKNRDNGEIAEQFVLTAVYELSNRFKVAFDSAYTIESTDLGADVDRRTFTLRSDYLL